MPSPSYNKILELTTTYIEQSKAEQVLGRLMAHCNSTADTLTIDNLKEIAARVIGAVTLYLKTDEAKEEFKSRFQKMVT